MNVPAELDKYESRLTPNARFAAWLQHESAGDQLVASRLRNGGGKLDVYMVWKPVDLYANALKDAASLFFVMVREQAAKLEVLPLAIMMATLADNFAGEVDYLRAPDAPDDPESEVVERYTQRIERLRPLYIRQIALWSRAWDAFCADERIDPRSALHAMGAPFVADLDRYADEIDAFVLTDEDATELDDRREHMLSMYSRYLDRMTAQPYIEGQLPLRPRRAPRKAADVLDARELHDDLSYLDAVAAAAARIDREAVLLTPVASDPATHDDEDWDDLRGDGRSGVQRTAPAQAQVVEVLPAVDVVEWWCPVCKTLEIDPPANKVPGANLCGEHLDWKESA